MDERHIPLSTVAGRLGVSERTVRRWIKAGKLRAYRPGRDYRIPESALREFVEESEIDPKAPGRPSLEPSLFNGLDERRETNESAIAYELFGTLLAQQWRLSLQDFKESPGLQIGTLTAIDCRALLQFVLDVLKTTTIYETAAEETPYSERPGYASALREMDNVRQEATNTIRPILDHLKTRQDTDAEFRAIWERNDLDVLMSNAGSR